jgi:hypothetical protein
LNVLDDDASEKEVADDEQEDTLDDDVAASLVFAQRRLQIAAPPSIPSSVISATQGKLQCFFGSYFS